MFFKYIDLKVFFISLALGLLFVYLSNPNPNIVYVYPTPDNVDKIHYKDKADNCFKFKSEEVQCPKDSSKIKNIPIQTGGPSSLLLK
jgi:hypothetical protein